MSTRKPTADAALLLDNQLCFALHSASLAMTRLYKPMLEPLGLTYPQYLVLLCLWETDGPTVSGLGERLLLDSGTLTPLLKRMEAAGWLVRERSAQDERRVHVHLTPAGRGLKSRAAAVPGCVLQSTGCNLGEITDLTHRIHSLRERLLAR